MNALTAFTGTPQFRQMENIFNSFTNDDKFLFGNAEPYPPYNAWFEENGNCKIEMAVAGFNKDELSIEFDGKSLVIKGEKVVKPEEQEETDQKRTWVKRGLARRAFARRFELRGNYQLDSAILKNGILTTTLKDDTKRVSVVIQDE